MGNLTVPVTPPPCTPQKKKKEKNADIFLRCFLRISPN